MRDVFPASAGGAEKQVERSIVVHMQLLYPRDIFQQHMSTAGLPCQEEIHTERRLVTLVLI